MNKIFAGFGAVLLATTLAQAATNSPGPTDFGFTGKEVFPIDNFIALLQAAWAGEEPS